MWSPMSMTLPEDRLYSTNEGKNDWALRENLFLSLNQPSLNLLRMGDFSSQGTWPRAGKFRERFHPDKSEIACQRIRHDIFTVFWFSCVSYKWHISLFLLLFYNQSWLSTWWNWETQRKLVNLFWVCLGVSRDNQCVPQQGEGRAPAWV